MKKPGQAMNRELLHLKTEKQDAIDFRVAGGRLEMNPSEHQRKRDSERKHSAP